MHCTVDVLSVDIYHSKTTQQDMLQDMKIA